jgi:transcriptional regulator with XRE-family HTH domain
MPFGEWLRSNRKNQHLTMFQLAELAGSSHAHISKLESGIANPSRGMVHMLAAALDVSFDQGLISAGFLPSPDYADIHVARELHEAGYGQLSEEEQQEILGAIRAKAAALTTG